MKNSITTVYLGIAGLFLLIIGSALLFTPHTFHGSNGIDLGSNPNLLSEIRAPGGLLAASGILALISMGRRNLRVFAMQVTVLVYGSFGLARLVSLAMDGIPSGSIISAAILELLVAAVGVALVSRAYGAPNARLAGRSTTA